MISSDILRDLWPSAPQERIDAIASVAPEVFAEHGITTKLRAAHLMAQISHECGAGTIVRENMNYSATRMMQIFGVGKHSAKVTAAESKRLANKPQQIAERVYGLGNPRKAKELGNTEPGDGWRYRGNGMLQLTGRDNHRRIGEMTGFDLEDNPEQLEDSATSFKVAVAEFVALKCLPPADADDLRTVTKRVNGGYNGLDERAVWLDRWKDALEDVEEDGDVTDDEPATPLPPPPPPPKRTPAVDVEVVQRRLVALGYHEVGTVDGKWGGKTAAGIAGFKHDRNPMGAAVIDAPLKTELTTAEAEGWTRPIADARATATEAAVEKKAPELVPIKQSRVAAIWATICAGVMAVVNAVIDSFKDVFQTLMTIKGYLGVVPGWLWFGIAAGVCGYFYFASKKGAAGIVESVRTGERN